MTGAELLDLLERVKRVQNAVAGAASSALAFDATADQDERNKHVERHRHAHIIALSTLVGVVSDLEESVIRATTPVTASSPERH